jgi:hypothetical protein
MQGTVTDQSGGIVPGASVTLTSQETQQAKTTTTSDAGSYRFDALAPGRYTLTVDMANFNRQTVENIQIKAEETQGANVTLTAGAQTQSITVSGEAATALKTENADVSRQISTEEIRNLPQVGRSPYELLRLAPGVFGDSSRGSGGGSVSLPNTTGPGGSNNSIYQTENQVPISANGQRLSENSFEVDGVSVNSLSYGGAAVITPNQESVKEIRVASETYSADSGRNAGAQVGVISQNGTDTIHGSAIFKYDDPKFNAYNKFSGVGLPAVRVNQLYKQFGGSIGGPIIKNRLFFFFSYEGLRNNTTSYTNAFIETPDFRQAVISARPNSVIAQVLSAPGIAPRIVSTAPTTCAAAGFSASNCQAVGNGFLNIGSITGATGKYTTGLGGGLGSLPEIQYSQLALPNQVSGNQYNGRIDYVHGNDTLAFSTYFTKLTTLGASGGQDARPQADIQFNPLNSLVTLVYNHVFNETTLNQFRSNFTRFADNGVADASKTNFGIPEVDVEGVPFARIKFGAAQSSTTPSILAQNTYETRDDVSIVNGRHTVKVGGLIRFEQDNNNLLGGSRPVYSFVGLFNLANGTPVYEGVNANPVTGAPADAQRYFRTRNFGEYVQDDWKARPNLTATIGLRYEIFSPLREKRGNLSNIVFGSQGLKNATIQQTSQLFKTDYHDLGPRLGIAYNPTRNLVVRTGFGIYYNRIPNVLLSNTRQNPPNFASYGLCCGFPDSPFANGQIQFAVGSSTSPASFPINTALAQGINPATGAPNVGSVEIYGAQPNTPSGLAYIYSFDLQYQLPAHFVAVAGYQGSADRHLIRLVNQNFLYPNNPSFSAVYVPQPDVNSSYNALLLSLNKSLSYGLQFGINYRFAKSLDSLSYGGPGAVTNQTYPQDNHSEYGPSDFDVKHNFIASALYELPIFKKSNGLTHFLLGGFTVSTIVQAHSGFPWTPKSGQSVSTPGGPSLGPTRPVGYLGGAGTDTSNATFLSPNGNFPGGGLKYFQLTPSGPPGIGRNVFRGPNYFSTDISLAKTFGFHFLGEGNKGLEVRANAYNAFNRLNLAPFGFFDASTFVGSSLFGRATTGLAGRVIDFQARITF